MKVKGVGYLWTLDNAKAISWLNSESEARGFDMSLVVETDGIPSSRLETRSILLKTLDELDKGEFRTLLVPSLGFLTNNRVDFIEIANRANSYDWQLVLGDTFSESSRPHVRPDNSLVFKSWYKCDAGGGTCNSVDLAWMSVEELLDTNKGSVRERFNGIRPGSHESNHLLFKCLTCEPGFGFTPFLLNPEPNREKAKIASGKCKAAGNFCIPITFY